MVQLPNVEKEADGAILALGPWRTPEGVPVAPALAGRALASMDSGAGRYILDVPAVPSRDREAWAKWAERNLKATQSYIDLIMRSPERPEQKQIVGDLHEMANEFVSLHGYALRGEVEKMVVSLKKIRGSNERVRKNVCGSES